MGPVTLVTHHFGDTDKDVMAAWLDSLKGKNEPLVAAGLGQMNGKLTYMAAASNAAVSAHKVDVGELSKILLAQFGGRGGGKPSFAQGGVATETNPDELFARMKELLQAKVA